MPDISSMQTVELTPPHPPTSSETPSPSTAAAQIKFSYTKNWGEVSNTLRKKLSRRLSALKESDDNSGDDERAYRSDRSQADGARSPPESLTSVRSEGVCSPHERSPDELLGADGLSSVRNSRAAIWQKLSSAASQADRVGGARFNRAGTTFQGLYVAPPPRVDRPRVSVDEGHVASPPMRRGSDTPDREYRSLAAFIARSATPDRLRARSSTPGGGRASRSETPERHAGGGGSPTAGLRAEFVREQERYQAQSGEQQTVTSSLTRGDTTSSDANADEAQEKGSATDNSDARQTLQDSPTVNKETPADKMHAKEDTADPDGGPARARPNPDDDDDDDENCLACESEARRLSAEKPAVEDALDSPQSVRPDMADSDLRPTVSLEDTLSDGRARSDGGHRQSSRSSKSKEEGDGSGEGGGGASKTVTHFVEVTSMEDGNKRITYVENGVAVEPVDVSRTRGTRDRRARPPPTPDHVREEEDSRSLKALYVDTAGPQSLVPSKAKQRHSPSSTEATSTPESTAVSDGSGAGETAALPSGAAAEERPTRDGWPREPGPHTGAIPKRRDRYGTRVVKFPKDRSRGRRAESPSMGPTPPGGRQTSPGGVSEPEPAVDAAGHGDAVAARPGFERSGAVDGVQQQRSRTAEASIRRGSVARRQALYESISEVKAARRAIAEPTPDPPPPPPPPARPPAPLPPPSAASVAAEEAPSGSSDRAVSAGSERSTSGGTSTGAGSDTIGGERNYRLRRSALEALPVRVPPVRELVCSRFREVQPVGDFESRSTAEGSDSDSWTMQPLDEEQQGAESDGDSSSHSQSSGSQLDDGKHSLLQYAMVHFRDAEERYTMMRDDEATNSKMVDNKSKKNKKKGKEDWTWREQVELVKWTDRPLRLSLLKLQSAEMARLAVDCFQAILRYMGDQATPRDVTDVDCVYTVLMTCHRFPPLRDEVYCQLMRQTTSNRSGQADSCQRGWRLLSLVAAFFACSDSLQPYLLKYLESVANDRRRAHHGTALICLQNLRRTVRVGGRKNVPSEREISAITAGRTVCRQLFLLPGGTERVVNTRSTTVVQDVLEELCQALGVTSADEQDEFSLYCVVEGDTLTLPLSRHEYIIDVTTELQKNQQVFHLILCRAVWHFPLRLASPLYVETVFSQAAPDYLEGLLLVMPAETLQQHCVFDIARVAALLHRAAGLKTMPTMKETKYLLPKAALMVRDIKPPQWVNMVQDSWTEVQDKTTIEAKTAVLETLRHWSLFGSAFFVVGRVSEGREEAVPDQLLAINSRGVHLLDTVTHETLSSHPFSEVLSTRRVRSEDGDLFIDIKVGSPKQAKVTRLQSENASEIARLIRQYSGLEQRRRPIANLAAETRERQVSR